MPASQSRRPFVDFRAIRERLTIEQVLTRYGLLDRFKRQGNRLTGACPIHQGTNPTQFRVDTEKNLWNCFSDCKCGGNVLDFIAKKEDVSIHQAALIACEWFNIPLTEVAPGNSRAPDASGSSEARPRERKPVSKRPMVKAPAPAGDQDNAPNPPLTFRLEKLDRSHPYLTERGLTQETIIDFGLGYFTGDKGMMVNRIVIPIHNAKGELVAYAGRCLGTATGDSPKYLLPPKFKKALELFNLDRAVKEPVDHPLVVVEGFFDAIKLHQHGCRKVVALMGSTLSPQQEQLIRKHTNADSRILILMDEDDAGREAREDIGSRLSRFVFVKVVEFDRPGTQPEHLSAEQVHELIGGGQ